jgi:hypothetical protein
MYQDLRSKVADQLIEQKEPLPYWKLVQLGKLFEIPTHPTMDKGFQAAVQATYGPAPAADEAPPKVPSGAAPDIGESFMTNTQQLEKGVL